MSGISRISGIPRITGISGISKISGISRISGISSISVISWISALTRISGVSRIIWISKISGTTNETFSRYLHLRIYQHLVLVTLGPLLRSGKLQNAWVFFVCSSLGSRFSMFK